ncbi:sensor histidine kinase [Streptomyces sp. NPDC057623]|uniref:sensor histidine kinase n=1 Tax=Streptomyces sp. NPDC057623 TaxID=3346187 RepID=UPI0036A4305D
MRELMSYEIAVAVSLGLAAVVAAGVAAYFARLSRGQRRLAAHWQEQATARDQALRSLVAHGLSSVASSVQKPQPAVAEFEVPDCLAGSDFVAGLRVLGEEYVADLQRVHTETALATRRQVEHEAREAAQAAVKSFATAMVSVGIDVSGEISQALRRHHDDAVFATLSRIDHGVQQMLHQAQSYVVLAGGLLGQKWPASTLTDVVGAAQGAIRDYARVQQFACDRAVISRMVGPVKLILSHLLDNAARYSPPQTYVEVSAQSGHHGVTLLIDDAGKRMSDEQLQRAQQILDGRRPSDILAMDAYPKAGFPVIALLARRYGIEVALSGPNRYHGMRASVFIPDSLLTSLQAETAAPQPTAVEASPVRVATESGLPTRSRRVPGGRQRPAVKGRASTEPGRAEVIGLWAQSSRSSREAAAQTQEARSSDS